MSFLVEQNFLSYGPLGPDNSRQSNNALCALKNLNYQELFLTRVYSGMVLLLFK